MLWGLLCVSTVLVLALSHGTPFRGRDTLIRLTVMGGGVLVVLTILVLLERGG